MTSIPASLATVALAVAPAVLAQDGIRKDHRLMDVLTGRGTEKIAPTSRQARESMKLRRGRNRPEKGAIGAGRGCRRTRGRYTCCSSLAVPTVARRTRTRLDRCAVRAGAPSTRAARFVVNKSPRNRERVRRGSPRHSRQANRLAGAGSAITGPGTDHSRRKSWWCKSVAVRRCTRTLRGRSSMTASVPPRSARSGKECEGLAGTAAAIRTCPTYGWQEEGIEHASVINWGIVPEGRRRRCAKSMRNAEGLAQPAWRGPRAGRR